MALTFIWNKIVHFYVFLIGQYDRLPNGTCVNYNYLVNNWMQNNKTLFYLPLVDQALLLSFANYFYFRTFAWPLAGLSQALANHFCKREMIYRSRYVYKNYAGSTQSKLAVNKLLPSSKSRKKKTRTLWIQTCVKLKRPAHLSSNTQVVNIANVLDCVQNFNFCLLVDDYGKKLII